MKQNVAILVIGIILIFVSLFLFTKPAIWSIWDFSNTGEIGDTIGGITAPIINLIGAFLVYVSFKAQVSANKIQTDALSDEKERNKNNNLFEKHLSLFDNIQSRLNGLEFVVEIREKNNPDGSITTPIFITYKGINALNEYVLRIEDIGRKYDLYYNQSYNTYGMYISFQFMLSAILDLLCRIENNVTNIHDIEYLQNTIKIFYEIFLNDFGERIIRVYKDSSNDELKKTKYQIDQKLIQNTPY